ncbi:MAG: response regulator transcription factor [Acidobacteriaceae bacterium]
MDTLSPKSPVRVLIVDDHPVVCAGLTSLLRRQSGLRVAGEAHTGEEALEIVHRTSIDVVLLDIRMPKITGLELLPLLRNLPAPPNVVMLSSYDYEEDIYRAVRAGASGYLSKDATRAEIVAAIVAVHNGGRYFPPAVAARMAQRELRSSLSSREIEILRMVSKGLTNKEIARVLQISQYTVRNHLNHISAKLDVTDRTEAAMVAMQQGIINSN